MMEKKRPVGVIIISVLEILIGLKLLYPYVRYILPFSYSPFSIAGAVSYLSFAGSIFLIIVGMITIQLKSIARKLNLFFSPLIVFSFYFSLLDVVPSQKIADIFIFWGIKDAVFRFIPMAAQIIFITMMFIFYFTRPKIRAQFKGEK